MVRTTATLGHSAVANSVVIQVGCHIFFIKGQLSNLFMFSCQHII